MEALHELIQGCINMDRSAQNRLYDLFAPKMMIVCLRYADSHEEAEDVLHEAFMRVFTHIDQYKFAGSFEGWIRKIIVNSSLQKIRSKPSLHAVSTIEELKTEPFSTQDVISQISSKELLLLIQQLPPAYKMVFNLYVFEGMKHKEIASLLGISEGTSKSNLSDARAILQKAVVKKFELTKQNSSFI